MAIFESTAFTKLSKSFGNLTTYFSRGKNIVRAKTTTVTNPRTLDQRIQRAKMKTLVELCDVYDSAILLGFPRRPVGETPYNAFVRSNMPFVEVTEDLAVTVNYEKLVCSMGKRNVPPISVTVDAEGGLLTFTHTAGDFGKRAAADDQLYAVVYERVKNNAKVFKLKTRKEVGMVEVSLPEGWDTENLVIYAFVLAAKERQASETVCIMPN